MFQTASFILNLSLYLNAPYRPYFASGFAAMAVGIAERMLTVFKEMTKNRTRAFMEKTWEEHKIFSEAKRYPTDEELAFWRTNQAYAIKMCCEAVGGSTWIHDNEIQRLWRDCNMTAEHAYTDYDVCK